MNTSKMKLVNAIKWLGLLNDYLSLFHGMFYHQFAKCLLDHKVGYAYTIYEKFNNESLCQKIIIGAVKGSLPRNLIKNWNLNSLGAATGTESLFFTTKSKINFHWNISVLICVLIPNLSL